MRAIRAARAVTCIALASALCVPAAALAASADYYLKLGGVKGESQDDKYKNQIEILSWSWGATQRADALTDGLLIMRNTAPAPAHASGGGMGAGKVHVHDISATSATQPGKVSKVESIAIKQTTHRKPAESANDRLRTAGPADGWPAAANAGGVNVAAGDVKGDGRAAPPSRAAGSLTTLVPIGMCHAGARYPSAELGTPGRVYRLEGVTVASCATVSSGGGRPMESISLNYTKIEF